MTQLETLRRVVLADDNMDSAEMLATLLETWGCEVHVAHDGRAAVEAVREHHPEVLFLDIGLPELDGYEVARELRGEGFSDLRIVAVSGYAQPADRKRSAEAGCDLHLA